MTRPATQPRDWTIWLQAQRSRAIRVLLIVVLVLGGLGIAVSIFRVMNRTGNWSDLLTYGLAYLIVVFFYFNPGISDQARGIGFVFLILGFSAYSFYSGWLASGGRVFLLTAIVISSILIDQRAGYITAIVGLLMYALFGLAYSLHWLPLQPAQIPASPALIVTEGIGLLMNIIIVVGGQWLYAQALRAASRANDQSQASRANFHSIVDRSSDGIIIVDVNNVVRFVNQAAENFFNKKKEEIVGKSFHLKLDAGQAAEVEISRGAEKFGTAEIRVVETDWEEEPARLVLLRDITERKQAETVIRQANETLKQYADDLEDRTDQLILAAKVSRAASEVLDPNQLSQQVVDLIASWFNLYYVGLFVVEDGKVWAVLQAGTGQAGKAMLSNHHRLEVNNTSMIGWCILNGRARIALDVGLDAVRFSNPHLPETRSELALPLISRGQVIGALSIQSRDEAAFTEEHITVLQTMADNLANALTNAKLYNQAQQFTSELEDRVEQRTAQLEMANKELEAFSYSVSHDLRAPLRHLDGYSRILLGDFAEVLNDDGKRYLSVIRNAAMEMSKLIDDLLRLSRITRQELRSHPVGISGIVEDILIRLRNEAPERATEITVTPDLTVKGDDGLLRVALDNLLGNAWKFTSKKEVTRIQFGQQDIDNEQVFFVRDNGVGFDMQYMRKLFIPFQRLHSPEDFPGTGIGLAIVSRVIQRHNGRIWVESQPNEGTTFFFTLG